MKSEKLKTTLVSAQVKQDETKEVILLGKDISCNMTQLQHHVH